MKTGITLFIASALLMLTSFLPGPAAGSDPAATTPPAPDVAATGRALFQAKGCVTCHHHGAVETSEAVPIGPDLTHYRPNPDFVRQWLRDPATIRPGTAMPDLQLSEAEIEALIAFLANPE